MEKRANILVLAIYIIILFLIQFSGIQSDFKKYITPVGLVITLIVFSLSICIEIPKLELSAEQKKRFLTVFMILSVVLITIIYVSFFYENSNKSLELDDLLNTLGLCFAISSNHLIKWLSKSIKNGF